MDWPQWIGYTASALSGAGVALGGAWFWFKRNQLKLRGAENELDATVSRSWRELMEYKSEDFRKKNLEQDARTAVMLAKMDEMHTNHLKCERESAEREIAFKRETADREIKLIRHEARIAELAEQVLSLRSDIDIMRTHQRTAEELTVKTAVDIAAARILALATETAEKLAKDADNAH